MRCPGGSGGLSSTLTWRSSSCVASSTRLSPTLNEISDSARTTAPATVVPIAVSPGSLSAAAYTASSHSVSASRTAPSLTRAGPSAASWRTTRALATSPAGCPPIPSATATTSGSPSGKTKVCGLRVTVAHSVHGPTTRLSSLWSRIRPEWLRALTAM